MKRFNKIYLEITNICNLKCSFCPGTERKSMMMDREHFEMAATRIAPFTDYVYLHLMGEPLLHPELIDYIGILAGHGLKTCLTTNGTLLAMLGDPLLDKAEGIHKISISLQAQEGNLTLNEGAASGANSNISGEEYLRTCFEFALKAQQKTIIVLRLWNLGGADKNNGQILKVMKEYFPLPWKEHPLGYKIGERVYLEYGEKFDWPDYNKEETNPSFDKYYCMGLKDQLGILVDGTVVPCCLDNNGSLALGNIFEEELSDILKRTRASSIYEGFKNGVAAEELCKKCGFAARFIK